MSAEWLELAAPIVRQAGTMARRRLLAGKTAGSRKSGGDWVTESDKAVEEFIIDRLRRYFPDHGMLGEEGGHDGASEHCWVIDPIDGTTNFVHQYPHCAVSLAYCAGGRAKIAVIYDIATDALYTATVGGGAYRDDERLRISQETVFSDALFIASGQIGEGGLWELVTDFSRRCEGLRKTGSTVLDLAWLAAGRVDAVISGPVNYWDVAAGALLVREAGGFVSDVQDNTEFIFGERTACYVAATPKVFTRFFAETKRFCAAKAVGGGQ